MKSLRHVRWAVLRRNPALHLHPAQGGRTLPSSLLAVGTWRHLDRLGTPVLDPAWNGTGIDFGKGFYSLVGLECG